MMIWFISLAALAPLGSSSCFTSGMYNVPVYVKNKRSQNSCGRHQCNYIPYLGFPDIEVSQLGELQICSEPENNRFGFTWFTLWQYEKEQNKTHILCKNLSVRKKLRQSATADRFAKIDRLRFHWNLHRKKKGPTQHGLVWSRHSSSWGRETARGYVTYLRPPITPAAESRMRACLQATAWSYGRCLTFMELTRFMIHAAIK